MRRTRADGEALPGRGSRTEHGCACQLTCIQKDDGRGEGRTIGVDGLDVSDQQFSLRPPLLAANAANVRESSRELRDSAPTSIESAAWPSSACDPSSNCPKHPTSPEYVICAHVRSSACPRRQPTRPSTSWPGLATTSTVFGIPRLHHLSFS